MTSPRKPSLRKGATDSRAPSAPASPSATSTPGAGLTHVDPVSGTIRMVDVGGKEATERRAVAEGTISMAPNTFRLLMEGRGAKGDPISAARIAGIMASKRTADLIPLCHAIALTQTVVDIEPDPRNYLVRVRAETRTRDRTGVEMEALVAVSIALLTLYDMLKAVDRGMVLGDICLLEKEGGRSGHWRRASSAPPDAAGESSIVEG